MPNNRFYIDAALVTGEIVALTSTEAHHLTQVMRARTGGEVELVNGRGSLANARIESLSRRGDCELLILDVSTQPTTRFPLIIAQALPRINRLDTILEKGTELGMAGLWLFPGERGERTDLSEQQKVRTHTVMVAAMKQCGRLDLPKLEWKPPLANWTTLPFPAFFGSLQAHTPLFGAAWRQADPKAGAIFFVGPEAGFSADEEAHLAQVGAIGVNLHPNILRTDTAPLVALSLMSHFIVN